MGNQVNPPAGGTAYVLVSFSGIIPCFSFYPKVPNGTFYLVELGGGNWYCEDEDFIIAYKENDYLVVIDRVWTSYYYSDDNAGEIPSYSKSSLAPGDCGTQVYGHGGEAVLQEYYDSEPAVLCNDYSLHPDMPDKYEVNHIEDGSVTYRIANAQDGTNILIRTDFP